VNISTHKTRGRIRRQQRLYRLALGQWPIAVATESPLQRWLRDHAWERTRDTANFSNIFS